MPGAAGPPPSPGLPVFPPPPVCRSLPASNVRAPVAPPGGGAARLSVGTCVLPGTRVAPRCLGVSSSKATGARLPTGIPAGLGAWAPARHAWALGGLGSPRRSRPRRRHPRPRALGESARIGVRGQACWRSPRQRAGGFTVSSLRGALFGASVEGLREAPVPRPCRWGERHPGDRGRAARAHVGARRVSARARAAYRWQPDPGGSRGAASLPRGPGEPQGSWRERCHVCTRVCPRRSLVEARGDFFFFPATPAGAEGACAPAPARSVPGARGSAACEQPFAFLGHVAAACAGWRLGSRGHR